MRPSTLRSTTDAGANTAPATASMANRGAFVPARNANDSIRTPDHRRRNLDGRRRTCEHGKRTRDYDRRTCEDDRRVRYASERAAALIHHAVDVLKRGEEDVELKKFTVELGTVMEEEGADAVAKTFDAIYRETEAEAKLLGPRSEAAQRLQLIQALVTVGSKSASRSRRGKGSTWADVKTPPVNSRAMDRLRQLTATKILDAPPPNEPAIPIPPEDSGSGRERVLMRIGGREFRWVGSFEKGNKEASTVQLMPDGRLFVSACGAGYILDLKSHTLIEKIGDDVMTVHRDDCGSYFIVNHDDRVLECFAPSGRPWKTKPLGCGGFRGLTIIGDEMVGESRQASEPEWRAFRVKLATGWVGWG